MRLIGENGEANAKSPLYSRQAGDILRKAMELGSLGSPEWIAFRTEADNWDEMGQLFPCACEWMKHNSGTVGRKIDQSKTNADLHYWSHFFARIIEEDAAALEAAVADERFHVDDRVDAEAAGRPEEAQGVARQ